MSEFKIKVGAARQVCNDLNKISRNLNSIHGDIGMVKRSLRWKVQSRDLIDQKLNRLLQDVERNKNTLSSCSSILDQAINTYCDTESSLVENPSQTAILGTLPSASDDVTGNKGISSFGSNPDIENKETVDVSVFGEDNKFVYTTSDGKPWVFHQGDQEPERPNFDQGYPYDPNMEPTLSDRLNWIKWGTISGGADLLDYLPDGVEAYNHYRNGDGSDLEINLPKAYNQDPIIKRNTDNAVAETNKAVQQMIAQGMQPPFTITSECKGAGDYPSTENWQKAIGGYQTWVSAEVSYDDDGNIVVVTTVHEWDRYNFDKGKVDVTTQEPDDVNGRFEALGWAKSFDTYGSVTLITTLDPYGGIGVSEMSSSDRGNRIGYERREGR